MPYYRDYGDGSDGSDRTDRTDDEPTSSTSGQSDIKGEMIATFFIVVVFLIGYGVALLIHFT